MSNVLSIEAPAIPRRASEARMRLLSRSLSWLFTGLFGFSVFIVLLAVVMSLFFPHYVQIGPSGGELTNDPHLPAGMVWVSSQPLLTRLAGIADVMIATVPLAFICLNLRGLFRLYASGVVFARENAQHLKQIGLWLIAYPFAKFAANMLYQMTGGPDHMWFSAMLVYALLLGAVVFVIAQVMEMGHEIERERAEFI